MNIAEDTKLDFSDVLIRPKRSTLRSRKEVNLDREFEFVHSNWVWEGIPIMAANMDTSGTFKMHRALTKHSMITAIHKHYTLEDWKKNLDGLAWAYLAVSIGANEQDFEKLIAIASMAPLMRFVCIDVANGYGEYLPEFVRRVRERFPKVTIIAGNVVTGDMTEQLILSGADIVKVGIGSGSVCTTRIQTGVGYPQLSAIIECADAAHGLGGRIISDGGCTTPGDVAKAMGAGADFVMLGGMFAGHDESGGDLVIKYYPSGEVNPSGKPNVIGKQFKQFYGMSSDTAMEKHNGGMNSYRSSEGRTILVPYRGSVEGTLQDLLGGLRSSCTYVGARQLKELPKRTTFIRVRKQYNDVYERYEV